MNPQLYFGEFTCLLVMGTTNWIKTTCRILSTNLTEQTYLEHSTQQQQDAQPFPVHNEQQPRTLGHKTNLNKLKRTEITQNMLADHNKLENS